jgi:drug/metabolite transporter (DMT)-like permease
MKVNKTYLAIFALILANSIWGASSPVSKWTLENIQPFTFGFLRFGIAALVLLPFTIHKLKVKKEDWLMLLFISIIGMSFHIAYFFIGLRFASSINAPIIASAAPVFLILGSILFLHEKPKKKVLQGTLISLIGVLIIIFNPILETGLDYSLLGNLFFTVSMILSVVYTLLLKEIAPKYAPLTLTFWIFTITAVSFSPLVLVEAAQHAKLFTLDEKTVIGVAFGALFCSAAAYLLHTYAVKHIATNEVGIFSYVDPLSAIIIAYLLLGEKMTTTFMIGTALVFLGIFLAEGRLHYHPVHLLFKRRLSRKTSPLLAPHSPPQPLPINTE